MTIFKTIVLGLLAILMTSCFEMIEDVTVHKDGSGHVKLILNASQSKTDINALLIVKEVNGYRIPTIPEFKSKLSLLMDSIKRSPGFSNVKYSFDDQNFILVFEADFDKIERLNDGIYQLWHKHDPINAKPESYYGFSNNQFYRQPGQLFNALYAKMKPGDRTVLQGATYTMLFRFSQNILSKKNDATKISNNKKVVFLKLPLQLMLEKPSYWFNIIELQP
ncbi:MAG: hypothetical protein R3279_05490 [Putridiphycobacter sp.]|nr:hypothetical protein [Putridiphycobacter sp.]